MSSVVARKAWRAIPSLPSRLARLTRAVGWGVADQALSSVTNFAVGVLVVRMFGITAYGGFALALTTYTLALNVSRGLATDPLVVRFSGVRGPTWRRALHASVGTALAVGLVGAVGCVLVGALFGSLLGPNVTPAVIAVGVALPGLLVQDAWRCAFFAAGRGGQAFLNDLVWAVAQLVVFAVLVARGSANVELLVLGWGGAAAMAALVGVAQARTWPGLLASKRWIKENRDLGTRFLADNALVSGGNQLRVYGIGAVAGLQSVGAIRACELLLGPLNVLHSGLEIVLLPDAVRAARGPMRRFVTLCTTLGVGMAALTVLWGGLMLVLPEDLGALVLGREAWAAAAGLLLPMTLAYACSALTNGANVGLRSLAAARRTVRTRAVTVFLALTCAVAGAAVWGAVGAAWGLASGSAVGTAWWWWQFRCGLRDYTNAADPDRGPREDDEEPQNGQ